MWTVSKILLGDNGRDFLSRATKTKKRWVRRQIIYSSAARRRTKWIRRDHDRDYYPMASWHSGKYLAISKRRFE